MNQNLALTLAYVVAVFAALYFFFIAPQNKQRKAQAAMLAALAPGDEVVTSGGVYGVVRSVDADAVSLEVADGVVMRFAKQAVVARVAEGPKLKAGS